MIHAKRIPVWLVVTSLTAGAVMAQAPEAPAAQAGTEAAPPAPAPDPSSLLKVLPSDISAFIAIPSMKVMDDHVQGVLNQLQLAGMVPGPLEWIRSSAGLGQGLNENGPLAFAILSLRETKTPEEIGDRLVVYIPSAKPEALIQSLGSGEKDGDFDRITLMGQPTVAAAVPGFVVAAEKPDTLKAAVNAPRKGLEGVMSETRLKAYASHDLYAWADPRSLSKELRTQITEGFKGLMNQMNPAAGGAQPAGLQQAADFIDQLREFTIGIAADSRRGLVINWFANPLDDTPLARQTRNMKGVEGSLLTGLPREPVIVAAGGILGPAGEEKSTQSKEMIGQLLKTYAGIFSGAGIKIDEQRILDLQEPLVRLTTSTERVAVSLSGLPPGGQDGRLAITIVATTSDAQGWMTSARKLFGSLKDLAMDTARKQGETEEKIKPIADAIQWKEKAEEVDGAVVDHFFVDIDKLPKGPNDDPADIEKARAFLGQEGVLIRVAALPDNHIVVTFGGGEARFKEVLKLVKNKEAGLAEHPTIRSVAARLPRGPRVMEGYFALDHLLDFIMTTAAQFGQPIPIPLALQNAAPITFTVTKVTDTAQETEILVPMELMVSVKDLIGPIMMMMGGGMQPPPGDFEDTPPPPTGGLN